MDDGFWANETVAAIVGALSGGLVSWFMVRRGNRDSKIYMSYQALEAVLDDLEGAARGYWRKMGRIPDEESHIKLLLERLDLKFQAYLRYRKSEDLAASARAVIDELTDQVTGDTFETARRGADFSRALLIRTTCVSIRDLLHY